MAESATSPLGQSSSPYCGAFTCLTTWMPDRPGGPAGPCGPVWFQLRGAVPDGHVAAESITISAPWAGPDVLQQASIVPLGAAIDASTAPAPAPSRLRAPPQTTTTHFR